MPAAPASLRDSPEALVVILARTGDRDAFAELVRRRQSWIRNLMRRCCNDTTLADDLAQQVFLQSWRDIGQLRQPNTFGAWLKRLAINVWLQHVRVNDVLRNADEFEDIHYDRVAGEVGEVGDIHETGGGEVGGIHYQKHHDTTGMTMDLDHALAQLAQPVRLCVVLSYHEGMTHEEIAETADMPLGTVKSHIRRGSQRLQELLSAYADKSPLPPGERGDS